MIIKKNVAEVDIDVAIENAKILVKRYSKFVEHAPALLRNSMMLAYQTAVDEMLQNMDASRTMNPTKLEFKTKPVLLDENGNAAT